MSKITIQQWPVAIETNKGTVLEAALANGIPYPNSCRSGECGACKTRLLQGEVAHGSYYDEALSKEERDQGFILACCARPKSDIELRCVGELEAVAPYPVRREKATVIALEQACHDVYRVKLQVRKSPLKFAAGQYMRLQFGKLPARSFSMANRPDEETLEFHIRQLPGGLVSNYIAEQLKVGDKVQLEGPYGSSFLREQHQGPMLAVAGGTGLAPMLSTVRTALAQTPDRAIHLYVGVRQERDLYAAAELEALAVQYSSLNIEIVLSEANRDSERRTGFVHQAIGCDFQDLADFKVYIAGPSPMVEAVKQTALSCNALAEDIHTDPFTASGEKQETVQNSEDGGGLRSLFAKLFSRRASPVPAEAQ